MNKSTSNTPLTRKTESVKKKKKKCELLLFLFLLFCIERRRKRRERRTDSSSVCSDTTGLFGLEEQIEGVELHHPVPLVGFLLLLVVEKLTSNNETNFFSFFVFIL